MPLSQAQYWLGTACLPPTLGAPTRVAAARNGEVGTEPSLVVFQNKVLDVDGMKVKLQVRGCQRVEGKGHLGETGQP